MNIKRIIYRSSALLPLIFLALMVLSYGRQIPAINLLYKESPVLKTENFIQELTDIVFAPDNEIKTVRSQVDIYALRLMINDLQMSYPGKFNRGKEFLVRLEKYENKLAEVDSLLERSPTAQEMIRIRKMLKSLLLFQREVAFSNPVLNSHPVLFVVRNQYSYDHHNTETFYHPDEPNNGLYTPGGSLKLLCTKTGQTLVLMDPGPEGLIRDPEVYFGGRKIIFSMRNAKDEYYSIHEMEIGYDNRSSFSVRRLRRLTASPEASDTDPIYLPDGKIMFSSTRDAKYCHCNMHIMANLHRMDHDGANIHQVSNNTLIDNHASLLPDGRVLYTRWEYVDRNFGDAQGLWTVNPDGTNHAVYWGNNTVSPAGVFDARAIPGTEQVVCIFGSCHDRPWGAMAIINRTKGIDSKEAVERILPEIARDRISIDGSDLPRPMMEDNFASIRFRYEDPFPLTDPETGLGGKYFLVSRNINFLPSDIEIIPWMNTLNNLVMGIYLVDTFGNEILLHAERPGCFDPMPLAPHPEPRLIPEQRDYTSPSGTMYVTNVYEGAPMQDVEQGKVAYLRVVQSIEKRFWTIPSYATAQFVHKRDDGQIIRSVAATRPAISWAGFEVKRILGTVPVEPDGSAYFELPAEKFVYFQLLDSNGMMITTMRSGTQVQPGESRGCVGCHDNRLTAPPLQEFRLALKRPASKLGGWHGQPRNFNYVGEIQPIWDRNCVNCHDFGKKAGERLILASDKEIVFNASYVELFQNWGLDNAILNTVGLGLAPVNPAYAIGSHQSHLVNLLKDGHQDVRLTREEMDRIITWIDIGGPYYPDYASAHPDNVAGRAPLTISEANRLAELTGISLIPEGAFSHKLWVSFDRPELSLCLQKLDKNSKEYQEALAIIENGKLVLQEKPRADMPGFEYCEKHQLREEKYLRLRESEFIRRKAIAEGKKVYDNCLIRTGSFVFPGN